MHYYGGKYKSGKQISEILKQITATITIKGYIEPFCGALGVFRHMTNDYYECHASDGCEDLIILWKEVQQNTFKKPNMTEKLWLKLKESRNPSALRAYAGFGCSFSGVWFSTYEQKYIKHLGSEQAYESLMKIRPFIKNIKFSHKDYKKYSRKLEKGGYLIYCDPPYANSSLKHKASSYDFNHEEFWNIMRLWRKCGNIVVISERSAPRDFKCIWKKEVTNLEPGREKSKYIDKLFI